MPTSIDDLVSDYLNPSNSPDTKDGLSFHDKAVDEAHTYIAGFAQDLIDGARQKAHNESQNQVSAVHVAETKRSLSISRRRRTGIKILHSMSSALIGGGVGLVLSPPVFAQVAAVYYTGGSVIIAGIIFAAIVWVYEDK